MWDTASSGFLRTAPKLSRASLTSWTLALGAVAATGLMALAGLGYPWELMSHFHPHATLATLVCGAGAAAVRVWGAAGLLGVLALWHGGLTFLPLADPAEPPLADQAVTRIVWANLQLSDTALTRVAALAREEDAAIIALTELPRHGRQRVAELFPNACLAMPPAASRLRVAVIWRGACDADGVAPGGPQPVTAPWEHAVRWLDFSQPGTPFARLVALHPPPPITPGRNAARDAIIHAAAEATHATEHAVLVGDFNATPWSPILRDLKAEGLRLVNCGAPWRSTWFSRHIFIGLPIDAAYVQGGLRARCRVGPNVGSDHYPLILEVADATR